MLTPDQRAQIERMLAALDIMEGLTHDGIWGPYHPARTADGRPIEDVHLPDMPGD